MGFLNWIVVEGIPADTNKQDVHSIIKRCLQERRGNTNMPRFPDTEKFKMGHWCLYALLATDASSGIAFFLGQHKRQEMLGHKLLDEVTITEGQYTNIESLEFHENPTLVWHVVDYSDIAVAEMIQRKRTYQGQKDDLGEMPFRDVPT
ncbi:hypothetical protein M409DRAFT_21082 [Zasmidium cellare ATCC 36951]|uniref:Uncharacterized protein n=1 Tax=Zasmidium cellare ATCC 36951 TaxID=1080233 RepID=A0A6A6CPT0_ZASCE|nr:uncharacterized protein M409DRAFT_21082 [Zasmidium cellare ATCC 36951]KAF2169071.1 hypothetical protein M409DRAFT_21082 [Zasmidium cellare ATCC 36951]